jgi:hypothetical protein
MLPVFREQPGFMGYSLFDVGDEVLSISAWSTEENAEAADRAAEKWVADNLADEIALKERRVGEVLFSTPLGVSSLDSVRT